MSQDIKYDDAIKELEAMVKRFENAEIGVDELVGQIKRAGMLIKTCRQRLRVVEEEVQTALEELDDSAKPQPSSGHNIEDPFADDDAPPDDPQAHTGGLFGL